MELHRRYTTLDDERYWHVQPWPKHDRPAPWIVKIASEKVVALEKLIQQRSKAGDQAFLEALEMTTFLANLVGLQNVERFIPLADPAAERRDVLAAPPPAPVKTPPPKPPAPRDDATQQMPALPSGKIGRLLMAQQAGVPYKSRSGKPAASAARSSAKPSANTTSSASAPPKLTAGSPEALVIEDAVRLLGWGREWHELAEIIGRLAGRPSGTSVRRLLKDYRPQIERQHGKTIS
jgi:hypothetical protein